MARLVKQGDKIFFYSPELNESAHDGWAKKPGGDDCNTVIHGGKIDEKH